MVERMGEYGEPMAGELWAKENIPFNRIVKLGANENEIFLCDTGEKPVGVVEFDLRHRTIDGSIRTGWSVGELVAPKESGIAIIEAGGVIAIGDTIVAGTNGVAIKMTGTVTDETLIVGIARSASTQAGQLIRVKLKELQ